MMEILWKINTFSGKYYIIIYKWQFSIAILYAILVISSGYPLIASSFASHRMHLEFVEFLAVGCCCAISLAQVFSYDLPLEHADISRKRTPNMLHSSVRMVRSISITESIPRSHSVDCTPHHKSGFMLTKYPPCFSTFGQHQRSIFQTPFQTPFPILEPRSFLSRTSKAASACNTKGSASLKSLMPRIFEENR